jgi:hypothetical protein
MKRVFIAFSNETTVLIGRWPVKEISMRLLFLTLLGLVACDPLGCDDGLVDQCLRKQVFDKCMDEAPKTGLVTNWNKVISECGSQAYYQSIRRPSQIKPECKP